MQISAAGTFFAQDENLFIDGLNRVHALPPPKLNNYRLKEVKKEVRRETRNTLEPRDETLVKQAIKNSFMKIFKVSHGAQHQS